MVVCVDATVIILKSGLRLLAWPYVVNPVSGYTYVVLSKRDTGNVHGGSEEQ